MKTSVNCFINKTVIPGKKFPKFSVTVKNPILPTYQPTCWSTHHRHIGRHTTDASPDTLPTLGPTHYRRIDRDTYLPHLLCRHVGRPVGKIGFLTFTKFSVYLQGYPLSQEFRKILFHSPPEISETANGNFWSNVKSPGCNSCRVSDIHLFGAGHG